MHQIVFRLGLRHRPHWGSLQHSPDPLAGLGLGLPGKGRRDGRGNRREGRGGRGEEGRGGSPGIPKSRVGKPSVP